MLTTPRTSFLSLITLLTLLSLSGCKVTQRLACGGSLPGHAKYNSGTNIYKRPVGPNPINSITHEGSIDSCSFKCDPGYIYNPSANQFGDANTCVVDIGKVKFTSVALIGNQIQITGTNLESVSNLKIQKGSNQAQGTAILSRSGSTSLILEIGSALSFAANESFKFIISNAQGSELPIDAVFSVSDRSISILKLQGVLGGETIVAGQYPVWNGSSWSAQSPSASQLFISTYDASSAAQLEPSPNVGDYYIVNVEGDKDFNSTGSVHYNVGDWIMYDATNSWKRIIVPAGAKGDKGDQGLTGLSGPQGPQGPAGLNGSAGIDGAMGPQGPQGLQGPAGADGVSGSATDVLATLLSGFSSASSAVVSASDSVLSAFGKLQSQISSQTSSISGKADTTNIAQTITALSITGLSAPSAGADAVNKTYVDSFFTKSGTDLYRSSGSLTLGASPVASKSSLDINGSLITRTFVLANTTSGIDLSKSNSISVAAQSAAAVSLINIQEGGAYTVVFTDASTLTPSFTLSGAEVGAPALTLKVSPVLVPRVSTKHMMMSVTRVGTFVYMNWQEF